jgi:hypothetical protein
MVNQRNDVGNVTAKNVSIGSRSKAGDHIYSEADPTEALYQVRRLIELLSVHAGEISSLHEIQADAKSVETALQKRKLKRGRIKKLVRRIAGALTGVTALADAVAAVQTAVSHLLK